MFSQICCASAVYKTARGDALGQHYAERALLLCGNGRCPRQSGQSKPSAASPEPRGERMAT